MSEKMDSPATSAENGEFASTSARSQGICQQSASLRKRFVHISKKRFTEDMICADVDKALPQRRDLPVFFNGQKFDRWAPTSVDRVLQCYIRNMSGPPSPLIEGYLRDAGFWHMATIGRGCKLDPKLIKVELQLGLPVDGDSVTGSAYSIDWGAVCYELLGAIPDNINGGRIGMGWLRDTFPEPNNDSTELERIRYARAYILEMIGGYLMPDLSRNRVHLRWLLKLVDFKVAGELSWGSAVLATLYREMCGATPPNKVKIGGYLSLLQSWARFCFPFLRPRVDQPYTFPLITRSHWSTMLSWRYTSQIEYYGNLAFDNQFPWHLRCSMMSTKWTYGNCIRIGRDCTQHISKYGRIGMIIYVFGNRSSFLSYRACRNTSYSLGSMGSHIYCPKKRGDGKFVSKGNNEAL
ncbi:hypothetical protein CXB51_022515 [Gossypium anomalum]|uniref:Aminotransferase-like plant mobile domain-containing protein n=1 Tax=Gossypium anomalum TaxID=47600 RepID=A0A8J5YKF0_9ROSI|nr:hypothetical protein CXB51_022515 [Gossypium anomalum]